MIQRSEKADPIVVHSDKLKVFDGIPPKSWLLPGYDSDMDAVEMLSKSDEMVKEIDHNEIDKEQETASECYVTESNKRPARSTRRPAWLKEFITDQ